MVDCSTVSLTGMYARSTSAFFQLHESFVALYFYVTEPPQSESMKWPNYACALLSIHSGHSYSSAIRPELWTRESHRKYWQVYYAHMDSILPSEPGRVLKYRVQEGWQPLCDFLGKDVPEEPFPHMNSTKDTKARINERLSGYKIMALSNVLKTTSAPAIAALAIGAALWLQKREM